MADYELIGLNEAVPDLRAPTSADRGVIVGGVLVEGLAELDGGADINGSRVATVADTNPLAQAVRVAMTAAASGSNGIQVLDNANLDMGTNNFTVHWEGSLPDWTPASDAVLRNKRQDGSNQVYLVVTTTGLLNCGALKGSTAFNATSTVATGIADGTIAKISVVVVRETATSAGSVAFYVNGGQLGAVVTITAAATLDVANTGRLYYLGNDAVRAAGDLTNAIIYNRALSAAEVLSLCVNGPALADIGASQVGSVTGDNSTFASDTGFWVRTGGTITISGGACVFSSSTDAHSLLRSGLVSANKRYRVQYTIKNYVSGGVRTSYGLALIGATRSANGTYVEEVTVPATGNGAFYIFGQSAASTTLELDDIEITQIGITGQWNAQDAQSNTGQIFDSSGNKNHALLPAAGATIIGKESAQLRQVRWTNAWDGTNELQYIGGVNQAILPANAYIESIVGTVSGATPHDIIIGDGSDTDRYVTITTGLAAGTTSFTLANRTTDGTNLKLTVDPDTNATMSIAWVISYRILE
jgi:hypothetical protein